MAKKGDSWKSVGLQRGEQFISTGDQVIGAKSDESPVSKASYPSVKARQQRSKTVTLDDLKAVLEEVVSIKRRIKITSS